MKRRQRRLTILCVAGGLGAMLLSLCICLLIFDIGHAPEETPVSAAAPLPYDAATPFSLSDLTAAQLQQVRDKGRISVSEGPRGITLGDTLETILSRFPSTFTEKQTGIDQTGEQSDEEIILYCASYFQNQNGMMTALPPRGLLTVSGGAIVVTLLAPTSAYPPGTGDNYGSYEHIYCIFTLEPDTMSVSSIVLGIDR